MARARSAKRARKKSNIKNNKVKYLFYAITAALLAIIVVSVYMLAVNVSDTTTSIINASAQNYNTLFTISLELFFPFIVFSYMLSRGKSLKKIVNELGLSKKSISLKIVVIGIAIFLSVLLLGYVISGIYTVANIPQPQQVQQILSSMPIYLLVFSFLVAPFCEEILFRGFLVPRIGIIISAIIFAILHLGYGTVPEFVAALFFGLVAGYIFKKSKSLYATIIAHILVNMLTVLTIVLMFVRL